MLHRNARLTVRVRLEMVQQVEYGWPQAEVARQFRVSRATVAKYVCRYREQGEPGLVDRSSRPHSSPRQTPPRTVKAICKLRRRPSWGAPRIGFHLDMPRPTGHAHGQGLRRTRAIENGCFIFAPSQSGVHEGGRKTFGHSLIVDPWGEVLADGGEGVGFITAEIDAAKVADARTKIPSLAHDRDFE